MVIDALPCVTFEMFCDARTNDAIYKESVFFGVLFLLIQHLMRRLMVSSVPRFVIGDREELV